MWIAAQQRDDRLHLWIVDTEGAVSVSGLTNANVSFEEQVLALTAKYLPSGTVTLVVCAGNGASPQVKVPTAPALARQTSSNDTRLALFSIPRMMQAQPVDVMQGDEATVAGFILQYPEWDGVLCITGSSTRWVHISAGEVVSFQSFMTGELFGLLGTHSSLRTALKGEDWQADVFEEAVGDAMSRPERMGSTLAALRSDAVLSGAQSGIARARLSGTLIGAELAAARAYWLGQNIALIGEGQITDCYAVALAAQGAMMERHAVGEMTLRGLRNAYDNLRRN